MTVDGQVENAAEAIAWADFCDRLKQSGLALLQEPFPNGPLDKVDGFLQLSQLLDMAMRWYVIGSDPDFPSFCQMNDTPEVADNLFAPVSSNNTYIVRGHISTLFDINISVHEGWGFVEGETSNVSGDLGRKDLNIDNNGHFELVLSAEKTQSGNWLKLPAEARFIQIREYFADWSNHTPGTFEIVRTGSEGRSPPRMQPVELAERLQKALTWTENYQRAHQGYIKNIFPSTPNSIAKPVQHAGGNSNIQYGFGSFKLKPDEALLIIFAEPDARLWTIQWLTNWYENPDMANHITSLTGTDIHVDTDGYVRLVLSAADPGVPNWLDISGYEQGVFVTRWIWCRQGPDINTEVSQTSDLRQKLPKDHPEVSADQRREQIARRRSHLALRRR